MDNHTVSYPAESGIQVLSIQMVTVHYFSEGALLSLKGWAPLLLYQEKKQWRSKQKGLTLEKVI